MLTLIKENYEYHTQKKGKKILQSLYQCDCGKLVSTRSTVVKSGKINRCAECGRISATLKVRGNRALTIIDEFISVHKDRYDYSKVEFLNMKTKVKIICKEHGEFNMTPKAHISLRSNCPICAQNLRSIKLRKYNKSRTGTLYYVYFSKLDVYKLGVTTCMSSRFNGEIEKPIILYSKTFSTEKEAYFVETMLLKEYFHLIIPKFSALVRGGNTEVLCKNILKTLSESVETIENTNEFKILVSE